MYRKLRSITGSGSTKADVNFIYNPFGQRVVKIVKPKVNGVVDKQSNWKYTYYSYDANGQVMAVYSCVLDPTNATLNQATLKEQHLYGSQRLGMVNKNTNVYENNTANTAISSLVQNTYGNTNYELTNHLGNVNAVITDRRFWNTTTLKYEADVEMKKDYYPFGMEMPGRTFNSDSYRYGYNGMELDNEISGNGNSYTTEFRQYDPRLGRWKSLDPKRLKYSDISPYVAFNNNPTFYIDKSGLEAWPVLNAWNQKYIKLYRSYVKTVSDQWIAEKLNFTCEDFAFAILINFARENNLPLTIQNRSGTYNQEDKQFSDVYDKDGKIVSSGFDLYFEKVLATSGANDIKEYNSIYKGNSYTLYKSQPGQLLLLDQHNTGLKTHTQVVMSNDFKNEKVRVRQGNLNYRIWAKIGGDSPSSSVYGGLRIQNGTYYLDKNSFYNGYTQATTKYVNKSFGLGRYEWDFQKFNNKSISPKGKGDIKDLDIIDSPIKKDGEYLDPSKNVG